MKTEIKWIYKFVLFDPKTGKTTRLGEMPERRRDPKRMGRETVINWLKITYGAEWYAKNKNHVGIIKVKQPDAQHQEPWPGLKFACEKLLQAMPPEWQNRVSNGCAPCAKPDNMGDCSLCERRQNGFTN